MKNLLLLLLLFSFCGFSQTTKEKEMQKMYLSFLKSEGFKGEVDDTYGNIKFKSEGDVFFISVNDDELFFEIYRYLGNETEGCSRKVKKIINETCFAYKSLTIQTVGDDCGVIKFSSSSLLGNKNYFESIFYRTLKIIKLGKNRVIELYNEE